MAQKPVLRGEVGARALRVRSDVRGHGQVRLCKALGCGKCGCLKPIRACCVVGSAFFLVAPPRGGCAMAPRDSGMCWKQFMMCLEEIQFVAGVHSPPMHDPSRRRNSRPCDGSASARVPVYGDVAPLFARTLCDDQDFLPIIMGPKSSAVPRSPGGQWLKKI